MACFSAPTACASGSPTSAGCIHRPVVPITMRVASPKPMPMRDDTPKRWPNSSSRAKRASLRCTPSAHTAARCTTSASASSGADSKHARMESPANW
ncbi:hypothetical protein [Corallococcus exiguus]|uniref:hypothetical protein n=1 Tax=Corallococcus exiguus TaxID=83462 RepID=UPI003DA4A822